MHRPRNARKDERVLEVAAEALLRDARPVVGDVDDRGEHDRQTDDAGGGAVNVSGNCISGLRKAFGPSGTEEGARVTLRFDVPARTVKLIAGDGGVIEDVEGAELPS